MSCFGKKTSGTSNRRSRLSRPVALTGTVVTIRGSSSTLVEDLSPDGARLLGRNLPETGHQMLLRTEDMEVLGRIAWANAERRGVAFDDEQRPSAGHCLTLQLRSAH